MNRIKRVRRLAVLRVLAGLGLCLLLISVFPSAHGGDDDGSRWAEAPGFAMDAEIFSMYVWRGVREVNGGVFQLTTSVTYGGGYAEYWGNMDLTDSGGSSGDFTEVNLAFGYGVGPFDFGLLYYAFPNSGAASTTEFYITVEAPVLLSPSLTVYQDIDESWGRYAALGIGHTFEGVPDLPGGLSKSVDISAAVGYGDSKHNEDIYGRDSTAFTDAIVTLAISVLLPNGLKLSPSVSYSTILDSRIRGAMDNKDNVFAGISLNYSF